VVRTNDHCPSSQVGTSNLFTVLIILIFLFACRILVRRHSPGQLTMYVPKDGVIYKDSIESLCCSDPHIIQSPPPSTNGFVEGLPYAKGTTPLWRPVIILIPVRLGVEKLNRLYIPTLKAFFSFPQSLGILGGKPDFSLYFVATQGDDIPQYSAYYWIRLNWLHKKTITYSIWIHIWFTRRSTLSDLTSALRFVWQPLVWLFCISLFFQYPSPRPSTALCHRRCPWLI